MEDQGKAAAELVEFLAKAIVTEPDDVKVNAREGGQLLELETNSSDRGRVIGRQGRIAKAMRAIRKTNAPTPWPAGACRGATRPIKKVPERARITALPESTRH